MTSVLGQFVTNGFNPIWYGYFGNLFALSLSVLGSAYAITKIVYAFVSLATSDHLTSFGNSWIGNKMGLIECVNAIMFIMYAASIAMFGYAESNMVWRNFQVM